MNINLEPKYQIGQKVDYLLCKNEEKEDNKLYSESFIINNIKATYNFNLQELTYEYQLKCDDEYGFTCGWVRLK